MPSVEVRGFGTWFYQRKCELLDFEIERSGKHPATWEKKGASLYTTTNVNKYGELRKFTNRLFYKIKACGGFVFYVGFRKSRLKGTHDSNRLYESVFQEAIKRIDQFCDEDCDPTECFVLILDEHQHRSKLIEVAARQMYSKNQGRRHLIEPPFHLESHRYQTIQAARLDCGARGETRSDLGGARDLAGKRSLPPIFRAAAETCQPSERHPQPKVTVPNQPRNST